MPQKHRPKSEPGKQSASRGPQAAAKARVAESPKTPSKSQASKEQASKAADAGAAPEQLDSEPE
jgi:hypothetical protein